MNCKNVASKQTSYQEKTISLFDCVFILISFIGVIKTKKEYAQIRMMMISSKPLPSQYAAIPREIERHVNICFDRKCQPQQKSENSNRNHRMKGIKSIQFIRGMNGPIVK